MNWREDLEAKIDDGSAVISIVGLGYVGLPLAVAFSSKFRVIGYDKDKNKIELLKHKKSYIEDVSNEEINLEMFSPTNTLEDLKYCDFIIIAVPTPLRNNKIPDLSHVRQAATGIGKILKNGHFVILKSTTYPGTTEEILIPILEEFSGLKVIKDFGIAYSPERVDPGNKIYGIKNVPNVIGGLLPEFTEIGSKLYKNIAVEIVKVKDCKTAESVKMIENIFRSVNIALVNELSLIYEKMDINIWEAIDAAKTKPYGFMAFYPGPGVGGHCIPLDPYYLSYRSKQFGIIPRLIETAAEINNFMPINIINKAKEKFSKIGSNIKNSNILILGLAYKANIGDIRESPSIKILEELKEVGVKLKVYDPYVNSIVTNKGRFFSEKDLEKSLKWANCVIIMTNHDEFRMKSAIIFKITTENKAILIDTRNTLIQ